MSCHSVYIHDIGFESCPGKICLSIKKKLPDAQISDQQEVLVANHSKIFLTMFIK